MESRVVKISLKTGLKIDFICGEPEIGDRAKYGGKEVITKMHWVLIMNH